MKPEGLKMSACSDFVEHLWKPGSCKNCFCPRHVHPLLPLASERSIGPAVRDPNGIGGAKLESTSAEDDGLISLPYSKPMIAVKPTMIASDVSDVWAEENLSSGILQVMINMGCGAFYKVASRCNICICLRATLVFVMA